MRKPDDINDLDGLYPDIGGEFSCIIFRRVMIRELRVVRVKAMPVRCCCRSQISIRS